MARSPRGRCVGCERYTTLMYGDMCRSCFESEAELNANDDYESRLLAAGYQTFRAWLAEYKAQFIATYEPHPDEIAEAAWIAAWNGAPFAATRIKDEMTKERARD